MQFYDEVEISVESWKWGNGLASGRRESWIPYWWPNGWDGGNWGSIIFQASKDESTLLEYKYKKIFKAKNWEDWRTKDQYGANAPDLTLIVPVETMVKHAETGKILHHFTEDWETWKALAWGMGGKWNIHFKDAVNQYPHFFLLWEPGQKLNLILELQLLGDVGLIGNPSVGKSSLINCAASTKSKVADYPFTTLVPNLWSVSVGDFRFNMVDIPGLIEWAAEGKWLWNDFLRHVLKARIFAMVMDMARYDEWIKETNWLFDEIRLYIEQKFLQDEEDYYFAFEKQWNYINFNVYVDDELFMSKRVVFVLNKYDLINDEELLQEYESQLIQIFWEYLKEHWYKSLPEDVIKKNIFVTSAWTYMWVWEWCRALAEMLKDMPKVEIPTVEPRIAFEFDDDEAEMITDITDEEKDFLVEEWYLEPAAARYTNVYEIKNAEICRLVFITPWGNDEAEMWFWKQMDQKWYINLLEEFWARKWDVLKIKSYYYGQDDKYIMY